MAIYTELSSLQIEAVAKAYGLGVVQSIRYLPEGSINTNAQLKADSGLYMLRHTTVRSESDLEFEAGLLELLAEGHVPAVTMLRTGDKAASVPCGGGRACLFKWLVGEERHREELTVEHLLELGRVLGHFHTVALAYSRERANPYGHAVVMQWLSPLLEHSDAEVAQAAKMMVSVFPHDHSGVLPGGTVHGDLFIDNVKWLGARVSGLFDFEMACQEALSLDLAVTLNAWCFDGGYRWELAAALIEGYRSQRPLHRREAEAMREQMLFAAIRFCASRIRDFHLSGHGAEKLKPKDFRTYLARVVALQGVSAPQLRAELGL